MTGELSLVLSAEASYHASLPALPNIVPEAGPPAMYPLQPRVLGGYLSSGSQLVWRACGPTVEVLDSSSGTRLASWTFGAILRSLEAKVLSVCGVGCSPGTITHIVCGVDRGPEASPRGLVAVLSLNTSKIVRAFLFPNAVVEVSTITGGPAWVDVCTLHPTLRHCSPLVMVASDLPSLHLLDLALDLPDVDGSDEVNPASLVSLPPPSCTSASLLQHRLSAVKERMYLSAPLMDGSVYCNRFSLLGPNDSVLCQLPAESVAITALLYVPQIASLAIGYNFGAFQLYNLCSLTIDCASPYEEGVPGVISFAYQEPENDPRNCVYLWLCRSISPDTFQSQDSGGEGGAVCTLYSMTYEKREWIEGHGLSYQGLSAISPRFEFEADGSPQGGCEGCPTVLFTSHTITRPSPLTSPPPLASCPPSLLLGATDDDGSSGHVSDLSLCLFGWYSRTRDERGRLCTQHFVALFDINQWYQAQMPGSVRLTPGKLCPYFSFHQLNRVPCGANERVLAASPLTPCNITRHMTPAGSSERDWYPASLSYGVGVLSSSGTAWYLCRSSQQSCLRWLLAQGPAAVIMCPDEAVVRCSFAGLLSAEPDISSPRLNSKKSDRETVLEVCLSQHLLSVLSECVSEFSEGRFASLGCTLPSLLHWAWGRVTDTKSDIDALLSHLFSCGDAQMTPEQLQRLHHSLTVLGCLRSVLALCAQHTPTTTRHAGGGRGEVSAYATVVSLLHQHLTVTLWFQHCQLLPEIDPSLAMEDSSAVPYPALPLAQIYRNRRQDISELSPHVGGKDLLMIDLLMEELGVKSVADWGDGGPPVYPPPSLQALLNIYLLADVDISLKHRIVQYLFLDLSSILTNGFVSAVEQLIKFPASAKLSPSIIKLTQAFWLLDQKDFQSAVDLFLDPLVVRTDITPAQHRRIIRALLCQNEAHLSLCYSEGRRPPHQQLEDVQLQLFVLLANGRVREAFHYQRTHATVNNSDRLLQHLLQGCELYGRLQEVLQLPLLPNEESAFMKFLQDSEQPLAKHILTVACLRSYRYSNTGPISFPEDKQKQAARTALLHCYSTHLQVSQPPSAARAEQRRSEYSARQPLSACLRQATLSPLTKSKAFQARLSSAPQHELPPQLEPFTPFRSRAERVQKRREAELSKSECSLLFPSRLLEGSSRLSGAVDAFEKVSSLSNVSAHITALLSTPTALRRARPSLLSRAPSTNDSTIASTPQSILKVRSLLKRPMSPCSVSGDLTVPPPPRCTPRLSLPSKVLEEDGGASDSSCLTPKQLRFALPTPSQNASNDASVEGRAHDPAKAAAVADGDSDDHSDLDVQLEPYINLGARMATSSAALYEEQESWELMGDQSLSTEPQPSFSGVLQQASKSEQSFTIEKVKSSSRVDLADDLDSTMSDANENYFSFESEDVNEQNDDGKPNTVCVEEQETDDEEKQSVSDDALQASDSEEHMVRIRVHQDESVSIEKPVLKLKETEILKAVSPNPCLIGSVPSSSIATSSIRTEVQEELESVSAAVPESHSLVEEQSSQDATHVPVSLVDSEAKDLGASADISKVQQLHEISAEDVEACLHVSKTENQPVTKPLSFSDLLGTSKVVSSSKRRRESISSVSDEETDGGKPPSKAAKIVPETARSIISTRTQETTRSLHFSDVDESTPTMEKRSTKTSFLKKVVTTSYSESSTVKRCNTSTLSTPLLLNDETVNQERPKRESSESHVTVKDRKSSILISPSQGDQTGTLKKKSPSLKKPPTPSREVVQERIREVVSHLHFSDSEDSSNDDTDLKPSATGARSTNSPSLDEVQDVDSESALISEQSDEEDAVVDSTQQSTLEAPEKALSTPLDAASKKALSTPLDATSKKTLSTPLDAASKKALSTPLDAASKKTLSTPLGAASKKALRTPLDAASKKALSTPLETSEKTLSTPLDTSKKASSISLDTSKKASSTPLDTSEKASSTPLDTSEKASSTPLDTSEKASSTPHDIASEKASSTPLDIASGKASSTPLDIASEKASSTPLDIASEKASSTPLDIASEKASSTLLDIASEKASSTPLDIASEKALSTPLHTKVCTDPVRSESTSSKIATPKRSRRLSGIDTSNIITASSATPLRNRSNNRIDVSNIIEPPVEFTNSTSRPSTPQRRSSRRPVRESPLLVGDVNKLEADDSMQSAAPNLEDASTKDVAPLVASQESEQLHEKSTTSSLVVAIANNSLSQGETEVQKRAMTGKSKVDSSSAAIDESVAVTQPSVDEEVDDGNSRSPSRRGRLLSLGEVPKIDSPATPLRRSSRRSVTPSKFGTPTLHSVPEKSEQKTPQKLFCFPTNEQENTLNDVSLTDSEAPVGTPSSARKGRRKSIEPSTPVKSPAVAPSTPLRRSRRGTTPVSDSLQVIEEVEGEITEDEPQSEATPSELQAMKSRRKSRRSIAAPDLHPIDENEELSTTTSPVAQTPQSKQESKLANAPPAAEKKDSSVAGPSRRSIKMRSLAGLASDSQQTELESTTKSRRRSSVSSASTKKEAHFRPSLSSMKLLKADVGDDEESLPETDQKPFRRRSRLPSDSSVLKVDIGLDVDDDLLEEELQEEFTDHPEEEGEVESDAGLEEQVDLKGTRMRPLRKSIAPEQTTSEQKREKGRRVSGVSSGAGGRKVGIKRSRQSMRLIASETEEEEDDAAADVAARPKRQRRSTRPDAN